MRGYKWTGNHSSNGRVRTKPISALSPLFINSLAVMSTRWSVYGKTRLIKRLILCCHGYQRQTMPKRFGESTASHRSKTSVDVTRRWGGETCDKSNFRSPYLSEC